MILLDYYVFVLAMKEMWHKSLVDASPWQPATKCIGMGMALVGARRH